MVQQANGNSHVAEAASTNGFPTLSSPFNPGYRPADIDAGERWSNSVQKELEEPRFGILCLTQDNLTAPWILFEAGALAKTVQNTYVCPYLIDVAPERSPRDR